jgi:hypothetical protein
MDVTLENGYFILEGLLSKTGSYGQEKLIYGPRQFENASQAIGNPAETTVYFDKDNSWKLEILKFIDFIKNNKKVDINNFSNAYEAMKIVENAYKNAK